MNIEQQNQDLELDEENLEGQEYTQDSETDANGIDWKATALRYKSQNARLKSAQTVTPSRDTSSNKVQQQIARLELKTEGLSDDSINFLMKVGGREALKDPHVKAAIDSIQEQKRAENAVIQTETSKSEAERKFSPQEINAMSAEELYKVLPKARK